MSAAGNLGVTTQDIEEKGWKYVGYRGYSHFLASDNDYLVLRRFSALHVRTLLSLQDQIAEIESEIDDIDTVKSSKQAVDHHNGSFRINRSDRRDELLKKVTEKLIVYDELFSRYSNLRVATQGTDRTRDSIKNWLYNNGDPIAPEEIQYLDTKSDLVNVVPKAKSRLRILLETSEKFRLSKLWRLDPDEADIAGFADNADVFYSSDERIDRTLSVVILLLGLIMLISPLWILNAVTKPFGRLSIITVFVTVFVCLLSFATMAKPFETLAAAAAYSAVLMVFMQISTPT